MKKTLIASAIAAAALSTTAFAEGNMPTVYGNIQLAYEHLSADDGTTEITSNDFIDNGSTLGVTHEHEIAPGITGFLKAEFEFNADAADDPLTGRQVDGGINQLDEAYIGVKGGFGSVLIGSEDTVYEWVDMIDFTEASSFAGEIAKDSEGDQLQYVTPGIMGGFKAGLSVPLTNDTRYSGQLAGMFSNDMLDVALAYSMGKEWDGIDYGDSIGLAAKVKLNNFAVIGQYETRSADADATGDLNATELDLFALSGVASLGKSQLALGYRITENGEDTALETDLIFLQALHNLSDNMYVYVEYGIGTIDQDPVSIDDEQLYIGSTYVF